MSSEPQNQKSQTRPVFKFLAGMLGVLFLLGGCWTISFAFESTRSVESWRWIVESALFLFLGAAFTHAAFTGRWGLRK